MGNQMPASVCDGGGGGLADGGGDGAADGLEYKHGGQPRKQQGQAGGDEEVKHFRHQLVKPLLNEYC